MHSADPRLLSQVNALRQLWQRWQSLDLAHYYPNGMPIEPAEVAAAYVLAEAGEARTNPQADRLYLLPHVEHA